MILVICALHWEAEALISHWRLKKKGNWGSIPYFTDSDCQKVMAISGMGKLNAALATTLLLQNFTPLPGPTAGSEEPTSAGTCTVPVLVNFGFAGANPLSSHLKGELLQVYQVRDQASGRNYFLDLPLKSNLSLVKCVSVDQGQSTPAALSDLPLVDMEAAGFVHVGLHFLPPSQLVILKVVSDFFQSSCLGPNSGKDLIAPHVSSIDSFLCATQDWNQKQSLRQNSYQLKDEELNFLKDFCAKIRLTVSQQNQLKKLCSHYKARHQLTGLDIIPLLSKFSDTTMGQENRVHKHQQARFWEEIVNALV